MKRLTLATAFAFGIWSAACINAAENAVLLEGFEDNIDSASQGDWGGGRIPDGVALSQYTKAGADDINVTQGNKSLQIDLSVSEWWVLDWKIVLSDDASNMIREAAKSTDVARYVLRYDIIFPGGTSWMNNQVFFGNINDQLDTPSASAGGKRTMSFALDLVQGLPEEGPITIRFADNFDATEDPFVGPLTVYMDNLRLVDTYASGAKPVTTVLQGFEDAANPTGGAADFTGWGGTPRTTYSQYTKQGPDDIRVTEGTHALQVDYAGAGTWHADFTLPFSGTKLAEILKLDLPAEERPTADQLGRYTLRFDVTYPDRDENGKPSWEVTSYNTLADGYPFSQARRDGSAGQMETVSLTLDQLAGWSDTAEGAPVLMFVANADWADTGSTLYFDNFRLIDTGVVGTEAKFSSITKNADGSITVTWTGGGTLEAASTVKGPWQAVAGATSPYTFKPSTAILFARIKL